MLELLRLVGGSHVRVVVDDEVSVVFVFVMKVEVVVLVVEVVVTARKCVG